MRFAGKRVIVTGAAGAIGTGVTAGFAAEGARVCLADLRTDKSEALAGRLGLATGRYLVHRTDVRVQASINELIHFVVGAWGGIDILINCAGVYPNHLLLEMSEADWDLVLDTNLKAAFLLSQAVARRFIAQGLGGTIVNITSGSAESTRVGSTHYSVSKAGLAMLTRGLALELAQYGVRVNAVSPGLTPNDGETNRLSEEYIEAMLKTIPLGRLCRPEDTAKAVLFVCSDDASFMTGATVKVDGGRTAGNLAMPRSTKSTSA